MEKYPNYFIQKVAKLIQRYWKLEFIRFLIVGGINTAVGGITLPFLFTLLLPVDFVDFFSFSINLPVLYGYLLWFSFAYLFQVYFVFQGRLDWRSYLIYPFTQLPNLGLNLFFIYLFRQVFQWPIDIINVALAALLPIPIMFFLVRFVIKGSWIQKK